MHIFTEQNKYSLLQIIQRLGWFLIVPLVSYFWTSEDYANLLFIQSLINIIVPVLTLSLYSAPRRLGYGQEKIAGYDQVFWLSMVLSIFLGGIGSLILFSIPCIRKLLEEIFIFSSFEYTILFALIVSQVVYMTSLVNQRLKRNIRITFLSIVFSCIASITPILFAIIFRSYDFIYLLFSLLLGNIFYLVFSYREFPSFVLLETKKWGDLIKKSVAYTSPIIPHLLGAWLITYSGRWITVENPFGYNDAELKMLLNYLLMQQVFLLLNSSVFDGYVKDYSRFLNVDDIKGVESVLKQASKKASIFSMFLLSCYGVGCYLQFILDMKVFYISLPLFFVLFLVSASQVIYQKSVHYALATGKTIFSGPVVFIFGISYFLSINFLDMYSSYFIGLGSAAAYFCAGVTSIKLSKKK